MSVDIRAKVSGIEVGLQFRSSAGEHYAVTITERDAEKLRNMLTCCLRSMQPRRRKTEFELSLYGSK